MIFGVTGVGLPFKQKYGFLLQGPSAFRLDRQPSPCLLTIKRGRLRNQGLGRAGWCRR